MYNWALIMLLSMALFSGCVGPKEYVGPEEEKVTPTQAPTTITPETPAPTAVAQTPPRANAMGSYAARVTDDDLEKVYYFLMDNEGKEIELAGEKHTVTRKEEIDVEIKLLYGCCPIEEYPKLINKTIPEHAEVKDIKLEDLLVYASVSAEKIPKLAECGIIQKLYLTPEARDYWMEVIG